MTHTREHVIVREAIPHDIPFDTIFDIVTKDVNWHTHGFHKYPAKFIPHIPKWAISNYLAGSQNKNVLDPFCGSGTTLVESILAGHNAIGIDIDPLSALISKVKTTRVQEEKLRSIAAWLVAEISTNHEGAFKPDCENLEHWFTDDAIKKLSVIRTAIDEIPERFGKGSSVKDIQDLLLICFSSIIRRVSNADNQSQKTYVSHTQIKTPAEVRATFLSQLELFIERAVDFSKSVSNRVQAKIFVSSSTDSIADKLKDYKVDLAVTSPPYIKAIDYIYNQMAELFWIGDLFDMATQTKQNSKKIKYVGNKNILKPEFKNFNPHNTRLGIRKLDDALQQTFDIDEKNGHKHSYVVSKYFMEMEMHFAEISKCLASGTHYIVVVGDSTVSGIFFDTANFLVEIAKRNGFALVNKWGYKIKNRYMRFDRKGRGGIIEIDWVLDFKRL